MEPYLVFGDLTRLILLILDKAPVSAQAAAPDKAQKPAPAAQAAAPAVAAVTAASPSPAKPGPAGALMSKALAGFGAGAKKVGPAPVPAPAPVAARPPPEQPEQSVPCQGPEQPSKDSRVDKGSFWWPLNKQFDFANFTNRSSIRGLTTITKFCQKYKKKN